MKDLITTIASFFLLTIFILQFAGNQVTHVRIFQSGLAVESFREKVKTDGVAAASNIQWLQQSLAEICGCAPEEIVVCVQDGSEILPYEVSFPLQNLIVMGSVLGIEPEENTVWMTEKGWIVSTYEEPDNNTGPDPADESGDTP
ncbi:MAG: hypothetical protein IKV72_01125 [Firmicutes bacterium]|nr:hypothetical protein [Bacillota bacterium]MBR5488277.1 hypothetical protein [Bacillota bacterium]